MLNSTDYIVTVHIDIKGVFLALNLSAVEFGLLINVKMPTTVGILTFMSMMNFMHI